MFKGNQYYAHKKYHKKDEIFIGKLLRVVYVHNFLPYVSLFVNNNLRKLTNRTLKESIGKRCHKKGWGGGGRGGEPGWVIASGGLRGAGEGGRWEWGITAAERGKNASPRQSPLSFFQLLRRAEWAGLPTTPTTLRRRHSRRWRPRWRHQLRHRHPCRCRNQQSPWRSRGVKIGPCSLSTIHRYGRECYAAFGGKTAQISSGYSAESIIFIFFIPVWSL